MERHERAMNFDAGSTLSILDILLHGDEPIALPAAQSAWDAAWIACLTNSPAWATTARNEFSRVLAALDPGWGEVGGMRHASAVPGGPGVALACG